jgi:hypothetical protein
MSATIIYYNHTTENYIWYYDQESTVKKQMGMYTNTHLYNQVYHKTHKTTTKKIYDIDYERRTNEANGYTLIKGFEYFINQDDVEDVKTLLLRAVDDDIERFDKTLDLLYLVKAKEKYMKE